MRLQMNINGRVAVLGLTALMALVGIPTSAMAGNGLKKATNLQNEVTTSAVHSQKRIDKLSDATNEMLEDYRAETQRLNGLISYNDQLDRLIASQNGEMSSLREQIDNVTLVEREISPLMQRMLNSLDQFVELDLPFQHEERRERVLDLRDMIDRADVTVAEKFRRILEVYQIENDYGRTVEAYRGEVEMDGEAKTVDMLSVGRVALLYQTLDGARSGVWDTESGGWQALPEGYNTQIRQGLKIASKQEAPNLLQLPIRAPGGAE